MSRGKVGLIHTDTEIENLEILVTNEFLSLPNLRERIEKAGIKVSEVLRYVEDEARNNEDAALDVQINKERKREVARIAEVKKQRETKKENDLTPFFKRCIRDARNPASQDSAWKECIRKSQDPKERPPFVTGYENGKVTYLDGSNNPATLSEIAFKGRFKREREKKRKTA